MQAYIHTLIYRKHNEFEKKYFLERIVLGKPRNRGITKQLAFKT